VVSFTICQNVCMTLIGTLVSHSVIVQVSDRRISLVRSDGSVQLRDDITNKAVLYENRAALAYTGLAQLEDEPTDMWLARRLVAASNLNDGLEKLSEDLTGLFRRRPYRGIRHSVVVAGWKRNGPHPPTGFSGLVSNHFQPGGKWLQSPAKRFDWFVEMAKPHVPTLVFVPNLMPRRSMIALYRQLLRVKARGLNVVNAVILMAEAIQSVAEFRPTVGRELMVSVLPRSAVPRTHVTPGYVIQGNINPETPTFFNITASGDRVAYGPTIVMNDTIMSGFQLRSLS